MLRTRDITLIFFPAIIIVLLGLIIQIIKFKPQFPKKDQVLDSLRVAQIPILPDDPILGNLKAPITLITFADLGCPNCREDIRNFIKINQDYPNRVKVIFKLLPVTRFPEPSDLANAYAYCAHKQNKFLSFMSAQVSLTEPALSSDALNEIGDRIKIDKLKLTKCLDSSEMTRHKNLTDEIVKTINIQTVPAVFKENQLLPNQTSLAGWVQILNL